MILILFAISALALWGILKAISKAASRSAERIRLESRKAQEEARAEQARIRLEWQQRQAEARMETQRLIALEREQMRQAKEQERISKEQEKQAELLRKHDEQIAKLEEQMERAREDIDNITYKISEQQKYAQYLEEQRDKCTAGSAEYWKWQNRLTSVDDRIYRLDKQRSKAMFARKQAEQRLSA